MNKADFIKNHLNKVFEYMSINPTAEVKEDAENVSVVITGKDLNFLIGYRGESIDALQSLLSQMLYKETGTWSHISIDINDYRKQKTDRIEEITKSYIDKVRFFGKDVEMPPMSASERRQVHTFISQYDDIQSESTGERMERRVVLKPKEK